MGGCVGNNGKIEKKKRVVQIKSIQGTMQELRLHEMGWGSGMKRRDDEWVEMLNDRESLCLTRKNRPSG